MDQSIVFYFPSNVQVTIHVIFGNNSKYPIIVDDPYLPE